MQFSSLTAYQVKFHQSEMQKYYDKFSKGIEDLSTKLEMFVVMKNLIACGYFCLNIAPSLEINDSIK